MKKFGPSKWKFESSKRNYSFQTAIDPIIADTEERLLKVIKKAIYEAIEDAQTPLSKGGKMRVDTGFLRRTGSASLEGIPQGPSRGEKGKTYAWNSDYLNIILAKLKIGDTFYWGWTAHYAKYREAYDGFLEAALQKWQNHVDDAMKGLKK